MKLIDLAEGGSGSGRPDEGTRSKKNLWFQRQDFWMADIKSQYGIDFEMYTTDEEPEGDMYVTDTSGKMCYGVWKKDQNQGISFSKPRDIQAIQPGFQRYVKMKDAPVPTGT